MVPKRQGLMAAFIVAVLVLPAPAATAAVGDRLDLHGLIKLPTEDWSSFADELYTARTRDRPDLMWRSNWAPAGDAFGPATLQQSQMDAQPYGKARSRVTMDGPTSPTLLNYNPFSVVVRKDGSRALRITPRFVPPAERSKVWGFPVLSGVLSTAGKNIDHQGGKEFYASDYSVTIYRQVRLPVRLWGALWKYARSDYGGGGVTELDLVETMRGKWPELAWLSLHSDDGQWLDALKADPKSYDPHLTQWAGEKAASLRYGGLAGSDPRALHDWALVVSPRTVQWAIDGRVVFELPTPRDVGQRLHHDIIDVDVGLDLPEPRSDADLDSMEVGAIERYTYPGISHVVWRQADAGDGSAIKGAQRLPGNAQAANRQR